MHQANASMINPDVAAIPMSKREAIWKAMEGRNGLANLASGNPDMVMPEPVRKAMRKQVDEGYARYTDYYGFKELREGISSAYRQLRELLATFRLKMDDGGLSRALEETVKEFRQRSTVDIRLDNRLAPALLTPNEEIHVLQIVREALSNVVRHAKAGHAWVSLRPRAGGVEVEVRDDGRGAVLPADEARHYGMAIMRERSLNLGGELAVTSAPAAGTSVHLHFRHRSSGRADTQEAETGPRARQSGFAGAPQ